MVYLSKFRNVQNRNNLKDFNRELYFISYIACNTISLKLKRERGKCGLTIFTKIITNYIEDWYENIKSDYKPYADIKANPYGMVSTILAPHLETSIEIYVSDLYKFAEDKNLWTIEKQGDTKEVRIMMNVDEIKKILSKNYDGIIPRRFTNKEIGDAETLSMIYQHFEPIELNILCSHRDVIKSQMCIKYAFRCWSTEFYKAIKLLKNSGNNNEIMKSINRFARATEQIEFKTRLVKRKLPSLIKKMKNIVLPKVADDRSAKDLLGDIYMRMAQEKRAPIFNENYMLELEDQYRLNREKIYPLNEALIKYYNNIHRKSYDITNFELMKQMDENIKSMRRALEKESIIGKINKSEIESNLQIVFNEYQKLYKVEYDLLKCYRLKGKEKERVDWNNSKDGLGESW